MDKIENVVGVVEYDPQLLQLFQEVVEYIPQHLHNVARVVEYITQPIEKINKYCIDPSTCNNKNYSKIGPIAIGKHSNCYWAFFFSYFFI